MFVAVSSKGLARSRTSPAAPAAYSTAPCASAAVLSILAFTLLASPLGPVVAGVELLFVVISLSCCLVNFSAKQALNRRPQRYWWSRAARGRSLAALRPADRRRSLSPEAPTPGWRPHCGQPASCVPHAA